MPNSGRGVETPRASAIALLALGGVTLFTALYMLTSAAARTTGLWILPLALGYSALGARSLRQRKPPNRLALLALVIVSLALLITALTLAVYSLLHLPTSV